MTQTQTQLQLAAKKPADPLGARFCQWFNHGWHWIYAQTPAPGHKAQWFTETRYPLQPRNLWQEYQDSEKIIGLRFDNGETRYCLLDLDRDSPYHPASDRAQFKSVLAACEEIGLCRSVFVRSSDSGGIHVYFFLPEVVSTFALACAMRFALEDAGFRLRSGHLEIFPNTKVYSKDKPTDYNGHRLPLQTRSYWIDNDGLPISNDLGQFLDAADMTAAHQDMATLRKAIAAASKNRRRLRFNPGMSHDAAEWKRHLEERIAEGWTGYHQTNDLLLDFAQYGRVFLHLSGDALDDYVEATVKAAPGYERYCRHQHEIRRRIADRARGVDNGYYVPYRGFPKRDERSYQENFKQPQNNIIKLENQANVSSRQQAADRIRQAIAHLEATDTLPYGVTARAAAIIATVKELTGTGMSFATLHRPYHLPLWYPEPQKSLEPAQGELLHPTLEIEPDKKSLEPAQGELLHPTPLYEGLGQDEGQPQPPQGEGDQPLIQPLEISGGESEKGILSTSAPTSWQAAAEPGKFQPPPFSFKYEYWRWRYERDRCKLGQDKLAELEWVRRQGASQQPAAPEELPAATQQPAAPEELPAATQQPAASEANFNPTAPVAPVAPIVPAAPKVPIPTGSSPRETWRLMGIRLDAQKRAKRAVRLQALAEGYLLDLDERQRRETVATMQFLWNSNDPVWMQEVKLWLAAHPDVRLNI